MRVVLPYDVNDAMLVSSTAVENDYAVWAAATAYAVGNRVIRTNVHRAYERLIAGTTPTVPELDTVNWLDIGPTNRWAMFDQAVGTSTSLTTALTVQLALPAYDTVVLLNVVGTTVQLSVGGVTIATAAVPSAPVAGIGATVVIEGLARSAETLTLTINGTGTIACGTLAVGKVLTLGRPAAGIEIGINDYSTKTFDAFGSPELVARGYQRRLTVPIDLDKSALDQVVNILAALRSRPAVWLGTSLLNSTVIYGWPREWSLQHTVHTKAVGSISLESMALGTY